MKVILEFGCIGGAHVDNKIIPSARLGASMASALVFVLTNGKTDDSKNPDAWKVGKGCPRRTWSNGSHFVGLTVMDGKPRGSASAALWKGGKQ